MRLRTVKYSACSLIPALLITSCATTTGYYDNLNALVSQSRYNDAVALNESSKKKVYGKKNALLYYLDRGLLLHYAENYDESNLCFEKAKQISAELFTKSVTAEMSTLLVSDNMRPYYGEDFERALIHVFSALNYVFLGKENEALVEARQVDHFLKTLKVNYGHKNVYLEDAFVRYIMGMLYENQGQDNDAFISYRKALDAYYEYFKDYGVSTPEILVKDALRCAERLGFSQEIGEIRKKWKNVSPSRALQDKGELVIIHYNGVSPVKIDHFFEISFGRAWGYVESTDVEGEEEEKVEQARSMVRSIASDEQVRMAFPKYKEQDYRIDNFKVLVGSEDAQEGVLAENIGGIAVKSLEDRIARIRVRTIARAAIKFVLAKTVEKKVAKSSGELSAWFAKTLVKAVSAATELSDKRSWRSLPDEINVAKIPVSSGEHSVKMNFLDKNGNIVDTKQFDNVKIRKGRKTFLSVRTSG
jgi:hypothetical protein